jgi:hypothetical protein
MVGAFEGDLGRPLGLVTLYAAYAEGEIDELLGSLPAPEPFDDTKRQWQVGRKLAYAQVLIRKMNVSDLSGLRATLKDARPLFKQRNELVHGRLFSGGRLVSNRTNVPVRQVSAEDILELAERIFHWKEQLWMHRCKHLLPLLSAVREVK